MWSLRILSGDMAGQSLELHSGTNTLGRSSARDLAVISNGISKLHAEIEVYPDKIVVTDKKSTNGTFVEGMAIRSQVVQPGQKIAFHDVVCEIVATQSIPKAEVAPIANVPQSHHMEQAMMAYQGNVAEQPQYDAQAQAEQSAFEDASDSKQNSGGPKGVMDHIQQYIDEIVMPGAYKLAEMVEFKNLIFLFGFTFVVLVTALSTIPLTNILKNKIQETSQQRAMTIARLLANRNQQDILSGSIGVQTTYVRNEPGVSEAYVINLDGRVMAPPSLAQTVPNIPFIAKATRLSDETFQQIDDSTIGASVPIKGPAQDGSIRPLAYAVIMYDMGGLAIDSSKTFSLFVQTLIIALLIGAIVFFFLYKIVLYPISHLNTQISSALRDGNPDLSINYDFPELQELIQNLQSVLTRSSGGNSFSEQGQYEHERGQEAAGLVQIVGFPAIAINAQSQMVIGVNSHFQQQIGKSTNWQDIHLNDVADQALRLNISDILERCKAQPNALSQDDLEIDGVTYEISGQAIFGSSEVNYVIITFTPNEVLG